MASSTRPTPRIDVELSFDRQSHSFSQDSPPKLTIKLLSHAKTPLTLFTWNNPLSLPGAYTSNGVTITDATSGQTVQTASLMVQRAPLKRTKGTSDEKYFLTLQPNTPVEISAPFGRGGGSVKPQPKSVVERGLELDANDNPINIRRSKFATGVDGLEPDHQYIIGLNVEALRKTWWAPVDKDEILISGTAEGSYIQDYDWKKTALDFHIKEAKLNVED